MKSKRPVSERGRKAVSDFERKYNSELHEDESPLGDGARVKDTTPPMKNTYGSEFYKTASSKAPQYRDPSAMEAVRTFRRSYVRDSD